MDTFREVLQRRLLALGTYMSGIVMLALFGFLRESAGETETIRQFMIGLDAGLLATVMIFVIVTALRYIAALKNEEKCRALYIAETDERLLFIKSKMGGDAIQLVLMGLVVAAFVSQYFDQTVFFTLLGVVLFTAAVKAIFKIVYTKKLT